MKQKSRIYYTDSQKALMCEYEVAQAARAKSTVAALLPLLALGAARLGRPARQ